MGVLDRIVLTLYTLSLAIISFLMVLFAAAPDWVPVAKWLDQARGASSRVAIFTAGLAFFLVSVRLIIFAFSRRGSGQAVVHETALGDVRISLDAVENLVRRVSRGIKGVREIKAQVTQASGGLVVELKGVISPEVSIPDVSEEVQNAVKSYVKRVVGVEVAEVRLHVENISNEAKRRLD